ncbi:MAG: hypothetical protein DDT23_01347 [candidate division WS2 bacterium]|nr:hypothetical protein [Candidatus Lithacetigena glycinireducens]
MTARQAIEQECKRCCGEAWNWRSICAIPNCAIHFTKRRGSSVQKIKKFCLKCNPKQNLQGIRECDGKYFDGLICVLHPFRFGKNPNRPKRVFTTEQRAAMRLNLSKNIGRGASTASHLR